MTREVTTKLQEKQNFGKTKLFLSFSIEEKRINERMGMRGGRDRRS